MPLDPQNPIFGFLDEHYCDSEERRALRQDALDVIQAISDRKLTEMRVADLMTMVPEERISDCLICVVAPLLRNEAGILERAYFLTDEDGTEHRLNADQITMMYEETPFPHPVTGEMVDYPGEATIMKWLIVPGHFDHHPGELANAA
jgi:hypothetical protein